MGAARPAATYASASAARSSVRCTRLIGVTPGVSAGSVQRNAGRPAAARSASIRARSSRKWIALTGVTPRSMGWSVNAVGDAWYTVTRWPATTSAPVRGPPAFAATV